MSKERITAYLTDKAKTQDIDKREFDRLTELIEGYLNQIEEVKNCMNCFYVNKCLFDDPCHTCHDDLSNFKPKDYLTTK